MASHPGAAVGGPRRRDCGHLRVLYMSKSADDAIVSRGILELGIDFLRRPFDVSQLLRSVRALLDRPSHREAK